MRLVLCDTQAMFLDALGAALRLRGHEVTVCGDPVSMVELVAEVQPDACALGFRSSQELHILGSLRQAAPAAALVLVVAHSSATVWQLYDNGSVTALVSHACGVDGLERALRDGCTGRRSLAGVVRPAARRPSNHEMLTDREFQVLRLMADGMSTIQMSIRLGLSAHTVRTYVHNVLHKLGAARRVLAVRRAEELGLIEPHPIHLVG